MFLENDMSSKTNAFKNFLDISATIDSSFYTDCSNSGFSSLFGEIFERRSSMSRHCSDDSMSTSS
jgi:hypothetical protein